jgi:outer membrane cobalamin receptor
MTAARRPIVRTLVVFFLTFSSSFTGLVAQSPASAKATAGQQPAPTVTETVIVTASQVEQPLSKVPDSVTVIPGRQIEARQQFGVGAVLRSVPGMTVQQNGGPGTVTSVFTRGGESDFTLVLIDGIRANAFGGGIDLSQVPVNDVDRIEVVRGPQSALYGSDAIGGVVHVITRTGGKPSAQAQVETGGRAMRRAGGASTGEINGARWQFAADHVQDAGFTGKAANGRTVSNDDATTQQVKGGFGWRSASSGTDLNGHVLYVKTDRGSPGAYGSDPAHRYSGVDTVARGKTDRVGGGVRWLQPWGGASSRVRHRVEIDRADYDLDFKSAFGSSVGSTTRSHARGQVDFSATSALGVSAGAEWLGETGESTYIVGDTGGMIPVERSVLGTFAEARWNAGDRATLTAGVRGEHIVRKALAGDPPTAFSPRPAFADNTVNSVNPKLAAAVLVGGDSPAGGARQWTRIRGAFGTGIRPPDAFEIAFTDNPGLKPERSRSGEFGVTQALASGNVQLDATAFFNSYADLIVSVGRSFSGLSRFRTDNISNARARGVEAAASIRAKGGFDLRWAYTFLDSEILAVSGATAAPAPYQVGDGLLRRPRHQGSFDATFTPMEGGGFSRRLSVFFQVFIRGEALDAEPAFGPTGGLYMNDGYSVVNLGASFRPVRAFEVFARALNVFDRRYEEVFGYPAPGRTGYMGVRVAVGR